MIKFFRRIRQQLVSQNKFSKYLIYAIGEIILVVIGILIALQLNNLNEKYKDAEFEKEILTQVQENLGNDSETLKQIAINFNRAIVSSERILASDVSQKTADSISFWLGAIIQFDRFQPLTNAYEVLKSNGLDKVSNKELRFVLGKYYDDQAPRMVKSVSDIEYAFNNHWMPELFDEIKDFKFNEYAVLKDYSQLLKPTKLRNILKLSRDNFTSGLIRIDLGIGTIQEIQELIASELE